MHVGTHMDAPAHMILEGKKVSDFGPEKFFGRGIVLNAENEKEISEKILDNVEIIPGDFVLIRTGFENKFGQKEYFTEFPVILESLANKLAALKIGLLGLDTPSPDREPYLVHKILLSQEILIVENLTNLKSLPANQAFELVALPMKLEANAAFCRVIAKI